jgi:uncharacterized protein YggE
MAAVLAAAVPASAQDPTTLTIVETATVRATPDAAELDAAVERRARTVPAARRKVERRVRGLLAELQEIGVPAEAIRTGTFETYTTRRKGRRTSHALRGIAVRVDDLAQLDAVATALGGALQGEIRFIVSDPTDERAAATSIALQRARTRADAAAAALGMRVLGIRRVDLSPQFGIAYGQDDSEEAARAVGGGEEIGVEVGENEIGAAVAVVYEIGP